MELDIKKYEPFIDTCFSRRKYTLGEIKKGLSDDIKLRADVGGESYVVKIVEGKRETPFNEDRMLWYRALQIAREVDGRIASPKWFDYVVDHIVTVTEWIGGVSPTEYLYGKPKLQIEYGLKAGEILHTIHNLDFVKNEIRKRNEKITGKITEKVDGLIKFVSDHGISFTGSDKVTEYLRNNKSVINERRAGIFHNDVRLENFIISDGEIYIFDFDSGIIGDCFADFTYLTALSDKDFRVFSYAALMAYFKGCVPEEFWKANMYYCMLKLLEYAVYKFNKSGKQIVKQAKSCMEIFGGYDNIIPDWWEGTDQTYRKEIF